jgi:hypothetical protein
MTIRAYLIILIFSFLGNSINAQWLDAHLNTFDSKPNTNNFQNMIGVTGGAEFGPTEHNFLLKGTVKSIRSFHLMEHDFRYRFSPNDFDKRLKPHECECENFTPECGTYAADEVPFVGEKGNSPFFTWKDRYCTWKKKNGIYDIDEIYASIEAINTPITANTKPNKTQYVAGLATEQKSYPNKWFSPEQWGVTKEGDRVRENAKNYMISYIQTFCPNEETGRKCLVDVLEIGSEPWGAEPGKDVYHEICWGIIEALQEEYGSVEKDGWRMKLSTAAFEAYTETPGCGSDSNQYIDEMIPDAEKDAHGNSLRDYFDYVSIHNYGFNSENVCGENGGNIYEIPESPTGGFLKLKNMAAWIQNNMPDSKLNITEFGWNSECGSYVVGEANQAAYYMRAYMLAARYGLHKVFSYTAYNSAAEPQFCSTALVKGEAGYSAQGKLLFDTREKKKSLLALEKLMTTIKTKHFIKTLHEEEKENGRFAYLIGDFDTTTGEGTPTHIVAWRAAKLNEKEHKGYPATDALATTFNLPEKFEVNADANYFYLGWDNAKDGTVNDGIVDAEGNKLDIKLSGLPIVIPLNSTACTYDIAGNLLGGCSDNSAKTVNNENTNEVIGTTTANNNTDTTTNSTAILTTIDNLPETPNAENTNTENELLDSSAIVCNGANINVKDDKLTVAFQDGRFGGIEILDENYNYLFSNGWGSSRETVDLPEGNFILKIRGVQCDNLDFNSKIDCIDADGDGICDETNNADTITEQSQNNTIAETSENTNTVEVDSSKIETTEEPMMMCNGAAINITSEGEISIVLQNGENGGIEIFDHHYNYVFNNAWSSNKTKTTLEEGDYIIKINSFQCPMISFLKDKNMEMPCEKEGGDQDGDGICDAIDNCLFNFNPDQLDTNGDGIGDACTIQTEDETSKEIATCNGATINQLASGEISVSMLDGKNGGIEIFDKNYNYITNNYWASNTDTVAISTGEYIIKINGFQCPNITIAADRNAKRSMPKNVFELGASVIQNVVQLEWVASQLEETTSFIIEKSEDGIHFETVKTLTDDLEGYHFKNWDEDPAYGNNFYRIKQQFTSGEYRYSPVQQTTIHLDKNVLTLYPNPVSDELWVNLDKLAGSNANISIYNGFGQKIIQKTIGKADSQLRFDVSNYDNGLYYLTIEIKGKQALTKRFIIENWK